MDNLNTPTANSNNNESLVKNMPYPIIFFGTVLLIIVIWALADKGIPSTSTHAIISYIAMPFYVLASGIYIYNRFA
jgi:hypothetical protein